MNYDGFAKRPSSALRCIFRHCGVLYVRLIPQDLRALNLELFALPSFCEFINYNSKSGRYLRWHRRFLLAALISFLI
jgi:hypothetical protein